MSSTNLPTLNVELLRDLVTWAYGDHVAAGESAEEYPGWGHWDQNVWATEARNGVCQTSYCIAGQAAMQVGMGLCLDHDWDDTDGTEHYTAVDCAPKTFVGLDDKGRPRYVLDREHSRRIPDVAREALGLTDDEANTLFDGTNTLDIVVGLALAYARARNVDLGLPDHIAAEAMDPEALERHHGWRLGDNYPGFPHTCTVCGSRQHFHATSA